MSRRFYRKINSVISPIAFSITMDDHRIIEMALGVRPGDTILTLASAGDTAFNLLAYSAARVIAVDISEAQVHLTILKRAALAHGSLEGLLELLTGGGDSALSRYRAIRWRLPPDTARFWDENPELIAGGLMWCGAVERMARLLPAVTSSVWALRTKTGVADNPYLSPLLLGELPEESELPPYMRRGGFESASQNCLRLEVVRADVTDVLGGMPASSINGFALSNIADWLRPRAVVNLLQQVARVSTPGASVFLGARRLDVSVPRQVSDYFVRDRSLEESLRSADRIGYFRTFIVLRRRQEARSR